MPTSELIYYVAQSLDGYIADADEQVDWLDAFETEGEDYGYTTLYEGIDSLVMGSTTYEFIERYGKWPYPGKPSWVLSRKKRRAIDPLITLTKRSPAEVLYEIRQAGYQRTWLVGGGKLAQSFMELDVITKYIICIMPVILGSGFPLTGYLSQSMRLNVVDKVIYDSGVIQLTLTPAI